MTTGGTPISVLLIRMMTLFPVKSWRSRRSPSVMPSTAEMEVDVMAMIKVTLMASSAPIFEKKPSIPDNI